MNGAEAVRGRTICLVLGTSDGGVGTHVRELGGRLASLGAHVVVCGPPATEKLFGFSAAGARFVPLPVAAGIRPLADRQAVAKLRRVTDGSDLVHAHGLRAGYVALRATAPRVPVVVTWHNAVLAGGLRGQLFTAIEKRIARGARLNLAVSSDLVERIRTLGGTGVHAPVGASAPGPPGPANDGDLAGGRAEFDADRPLVLSVGRLHPQKGFDLLIEAAALLGSRVPQPLFAIAGEGPMRQRLEDRIRRSGAPVRLLGRRDDVPQLLATAAVVVMPSRWEGSPLAAHEALLAGRPLVAAAVGGLPDLADGGAIDLVPAGDVPALAAAIARVLDDPEHAAALAARGLARARTWPDGVASAEAVIAHYGEILAG